MATWKRAVWISDFHLGTRSCKAGALLRFLRQYQADKLYLVGDILDGWSFGSAWYWSPEQNAVLSEIAAWARAGTEVVFLPGNHDEASAGLVSALLGRRVRIVSELVHRTALGKRMLVIHGHQFDRSMSTAHWLPLMGSRAYSIAMRINDWYLGEQRRLPIRQRSAAAYLRTRVRNAVRYLTDVDRGFFERLAASAGEHRVDGVICGHIHRPEQSNMQTKIQSDLRSNMRSKIGALEYINDGDWVENCTALVEERDGQLRLLRHDAWGRRDIDSTANKEVAAL